MSAQDKRPLCRLFPSRRMQGNSTEVMYVHVLFKFFVQVGLERNLYTSWRNLVMIDFFLLEAKSFGAGLTKVQSYWVNHVNNYWINLSFRSACQ